MCASLRASILSSLQGNGLPGAIGAPRARSQARKQLPKDQQQLKERLDILGTDGSVSLTLPLDAANAALSGNDLVAQLDDEIRDYSAATETLLHSSQLAPSTQLCPYCRGSTLQDVARGLAAYTADRQLHLLRLSDGSDTIIGPGDLARFAYTGLVVAAGARVRLIPFGELPLH